MKGAPHIEAQTWGSVAPFPATIMYRARCACGWEGLWFYYRENAEREKASHVCV